MKIFVIGFLLAAGCTANQPKQIYIAPDTPEWALMATDFAMTFWAAEPRQIEFGFAAEPGLGLTLETVDDFGVDKTSVATYGMGKIKLLKALETWAPAHRGCVVAHEIGHSLGLDHVEGEPSLMNASADEFVFANNCLWSSLDQAEFCQTNDC